jgi:hypothetical protein
MRGIPVGSEMPEEMVKIFKTDVYEEIKQEILQGRPTDLFASNENLDPLEIEGEEILVPSFNIRRKHDKLLREFGW